MAIRNIKKKLAIFVSVLVVLFGGVFLYFQSQQPIEPELAGSLQEVAMTYKKDYSCRRSD